MRRLILILTVLLASAASALPGAARAEPALTPQARAALIALKAEAKFRPQLLSGYMGADTQEDIAPLNAAVNDLIDDVLARPDGPLSEADVLPLVAAAVQDVDLFATEDRERAYRYFKQVWTILSLRGDPIRQIP